MPIRCRRALESVRKRFPEVPVQIVLGGLAPDSSEPMEESMRAYVQQACRAVVITRQHGLEREMFAAIQQAYYLDARNPSDDDTLADLAHGFGLDHADFLAALHSEETEAALNKDFEIRRSMGANSFPSLGIERGGERMLVHRGWGDEELVLRILSSKLE
ncbi:MAG: DsbA family protein [Planctomycetota bacterium]|jgi:putative protein-disulfide isomerase|nr:DsbA family protein [Planctomycetota bacterium]